MKALELISASTFDFVEKPAPEPGPDDLLVAVRACGICGSDIHGMDGSSSDCYHITVVGLEYHYALRSGTFHRFEFSKGSE